MSEIKDIKEHICDITGSWLTNLIIDGQEYWHIDKMEPMLPYPIPNSLPSDPRYREDLIWLRRENENNAQVWKNRLEIQQRYERKLRQEVEKKKNKKK